FESIMDRAEREHRTDLLTEWFEQASDGPLKSTLAMRAVESLRTKSTDDAIEFLTNVGDAKWRDWDMYWPVAGDLAKRDPQAALDWIFSLPKFPDEPAPPGLAAVLQQWHTKEPAAAKDWLLQHTDQLWWPRAARGIADSLNNSGNQQDRDAFLANFTPEAQLVIKQSWDKPAIRDPKSAQ
ncbi:MAG TPA: hypothetical protein VFG14_02780, partial [Chthoniobacteraceae bacterium]|nr:hypothetical protein [Chthoniobacteraceae bacterium]